MEDYKRCRNNWQELTVMTKLWHINHIGFCADQMPGHVDETETE